MISSHPFCHVCGTAFDLDNPKSSAAPTIDHCHSTHVIRGVLCQNCNRGLGHFKDDPAILQKAIAYLQQRKP